MVTWLFDNDGVLYDDHLVGTDFSLTLRGYMSGVLRCSEQEVADCAERLKIKHQTEFSVLGFVREFGLKFDQIVAGTYLAMSLSLQPSPEKRSVLERLVGEKMVFTANPTAFARRILEKLGLPDCFSCVIGMEDVNFMPKHDLQTLTLVEHLIGVSGTGICLVDDTERNLNAAQKLGWKTVHYNPLGDSYSTSHVRVMNFEDLLRV